MNEHIKRLSEKADSYAQVEYEKWTPTEDFSGVPHIRKIFNVKFAELIVKECAGIYDKIDNGNLHLGTDNYPKAIHKHFGVE